MAALVGSAFSSAMCFMCCSLCSRTRSSAIISNCQQFSAIVSNCQRLSAIISDCQHLSAIVSYCNGGVGGFDVLHVLHALSARATVSNRQQLSAIVSNSQQQSAMVSNSDTAHEAYNRSCRVKKYTSNSKGYVDGFLGQLTLAKEPCKHFL